MLKHFRGGPEGSPADDSIDLDVIVVGAGLSGICAGHYLKSRRPRDSFAILEGRDALGGTWDLFRYPGIRSDSDMYTLGFSFRPWTDEHAIAGGDAIRRYLRETAEADNLDELIAYGHKVVAASWSSETCRWSLDVETAGGRKLYTCRFLFSCCGYYDYDEAHTPEFTDRDAFGGEVIHPQFWPEDLDFTGKTVAVIGSGATAITLVPELAKLAKHVTMVQRTPTYVFDIPAKDAVARWIRKLLPSRMAHTLVRWKNILLTMYLYNVARRKPAKVRAFTIKNAQEKMGPDINARQHFNPPYDPWDQRFCLAPDGDFFEAVRQGDVSVVTDAVEGFTADGLKLSSGNELKADVVVTATGLKVKAVGGMALSIDGEPCNVADSVSYKGAMFSGIPNFAAVFGYTNASWTLKCELIVRWFVRLLDHMEKSGTDMVMPQRPDGEHDTPFVNLTSNYVTRSAHLMPKQGREAPWLVHQNYLRDVREFSWSAVDDTALEFSAKEKQKEDA